MALLETASLGRGAGGCHSLRAASAVSPGQAWRQHSCESAGVSKATPQLSILLMTMHSSIGVHSLFKGCQMTQFHRLYPLIHPSWRPMVGGGRVGDTKKRNRVNHGGKKPGFFSSTTTLITPQLSLLHSAHLSWEKSLWPLPASSTRIKAPWGQGHGSFRTLSSAPRILLAWQVLDTYLLNEWMNLSSTSYVAHFYACSAISYLNFMRHRYYFYVWRRKVGFRDKITFPGPQDWYLVKQSFHLGLTDLKLIF